MDVSSSEWLPKWVLAKSWKGRTCADIGHLSVSLGRGLAGVGGVWCGHPGRQNGQEREYFELKIDMCSANFKLST